MPFWNKKKSNDPQALHDASVAAFENGDVPTAIKGFANLCDIQPTSERLYYLGVLLDMVGQPAPSVKALNESVKMDPNNSQALYSLSIVHVGQENIEAAYNAVEKANQIAPDDFRIVNHLAMMMLNSPFEDHRNPQRAVELAKHACELTGWQDEICETTYKKALAETGDQGKVAAVEEQVEKAKPEGLTLELIEHFEKRFKKKANEMALHNIVPICDVPVAVQTIESGKPTSPNILFSTGASFVAAEGDESSLPFAEVMMVIPGDMKMGTEIDERIWPWQSIQLAASKPHIDGKAFSKKPTVLSTQVEGNSEDSSGFAATLLLPNVKGYVDQFEASSGRKISFVLAMPIYRDEYDYAMQHGASKLVECLREQKVKPHFVPGRKSLLK